MKNTILLVDDEEVIRFGIRRFLEHKGYEVLEADCCASAVEAFRSQAPDLAVLDYRLPDGDALQLLSRLREDGSTIPIIILTAHGSIDLAVRAIREGAEHFLTKPVELDALQVILERCLENYRSRQVEIVHRSREQRAALDPFLGKSPAIRRLAAEARKVSQADAPILIQGETGAGKGVLASWLHANGSRARQAFLDLNCAGLSRELAESELFGHAKGAFTGATAEKEGLVATAHRGTVFLDEIGDLDFQVQPKLLKVIEDQEFRRVGETRIRRVDVRLIAATHQNLRKMTRAGTFRGDLYFRLSTFPLTLPPLRERPEDIPILARDILTRLQRVRGKHPVGLSPEAEDFLREYRWPGNIRELHNVLERAALLQEAGEIQVPDLSIGYSPEPDSFSETTNLEEVTARHIESVLRQEGGRVRRAAEKLGMPRSTLYLKIKQLGIDPSSF